MRLFHVSEEPDIRVFYPRLPTRTDLKQNVGLVWAIDEERLPNFLTPRECPSISHAVVIENSWFDIMKNTTLYLYEFNPNSFVLQDAVAGYYTAMKTQYPIRKYVLTDLFDELSKRNVEVRITDNLPKIAEQVKSSTLKWSLCKMQNCRYQ